MQVYVRATLELGRLRDAAADLMRSDYECNPMIEGDMRFDRFDGGELFLLTAFGLLACASKNGLTSFEGAGRTLGEEADLRHVLIVAMGDRSIGLISSDPILADPRDFWVLMSTDAAIAAPG